MKMTAIWIGVCFWTAGALATSASATDSLAEELITLMKVDETMRQGMEMSRKAMMMQTEQMASRMGAANADQFRAQQARMMDLIEAEMSWDKVKGEYVELYATVFTESELQGLIEFYRSPIGQAFIRKQPELMRKSVELNQRLMLNIQPKIMQLLKETKAAAPAP